MVGLLAFTILGAPLGLVMPPPPVPMGFPPLVVTFAEPGVPPPDCDTVALEAA